MRPLRYAINVTLDGCCDHRAGSTDEALHRSWAEQLAQADALRFGREMMEATWRLPATGVRPDGMADWMEPFALVAGSSPESTCSMVNLATIQRRTLSIVARKTNG
jgi:hypothetical protein